MATTADPTAPPAPALRHNREFRLLWIGQALSDFGSSMTFLVMPLVLLAAGYSPATAAVIGTAWMAVGLLVRLPAGWISDRLDQRTLMLGCDLLRLVSMGAVALVVLARPLPLPLALGSVLLSAAALEVFRPAQGRAIRTIVPRTQLGAAMSLNQARAYGADITAPAAAGLLLAWQPAVPFAVDALTFGLSALCIAGAVRRREPAPVVAKAEREPLRRQLTAGWRYLLGNRFLRWSALYFTGLNVTFAALSYGLVLGAGREPGGAVAVGAAMSAAAVAGLLGSLITPYAQKRLPVRVILAAGPAVSTLLLVAAWLTGSTLALAASFSAMCLLTPLIGATIGTIMATTVPEEIYGRVTTSSSFVAQLLQPLGPLAAGLLLAGFSLSATAAVFAVTLGALAALALALPAPALPGGPADAKA